MDDFLTKGSQVEVSSTDDAAVAAPWYAATVIHPPLSNNLVYLEYNHLLSGDDSSSKLREYANIAYVRPSPVVPDPDSTSFQLNDVVDAFYKDAWWTGVVTAVVDGCYFVVKLQDGSEQTRFHFSELRVHRKWVGGRWLQPQKQGTAGLMFTVGKKVEVSFEREDLRGCWVPATILKNYDNDTFLVEYQQPGIGDEAINHKATVDYLHIRPAPPHLRDKNFALLEKVDAYYDFGWWSGVITKELADNWYNVVFKHTKKESQFIYSRVRPHMEWKGGKWFNASQGDTDGRTTHSLIDKQIEQTTPSIDKQSTVATSTMKKTKKKNLDSNDKGSAPSKKLHDEIMNDDSSKQMNRPSVGQSEGFKASGTTDQDLGETVNISLVKISRTQEDAGKKDITKDLASPVDVVLHCNGITVPQGHTHQTRSTEKTPNVAESDPQRPNVPFSPLTEGNEGNAASVTPKRKRGRPPKLQTPVTSNNQNGDGVATSVNIESPANTEDNDLEDNQRTKKYATKKGKRKTISVNTESPAQGAINSQDASKEKAVEKSLDTVHVDRPLSRCSEAKQSPMTVDAPERAMEQSSKVSSTDLPFVRSTSLWKSIDSMEAFRMLPQKPHFRPLLEGVKASAREGLAVGAMVTFSITVEKTRGLKFDDPRSTIEDHLETLVDLENNGFDVKVIRNRLTRLLLIKDKQEELAERSKRVVERIEERNVLGKRDDEEIEALDRQIRELEEKKKQVVLKREKLKAEIGVMEAKNGEIEKEMREVGEEFDGLVAAPFV